jgi:hypothetical protein
VKHTFSAVVREGAIEVPLDVKAVFGEARAPVLMTFKGETHKNRVMVYGGKYILGIWKAVLAKHGISDGAKLDVTLEADGAPRVIEPPPELAAALKKNARAKAGWAALSYTHQREWATAIADAKKPETRVKRVAQAIEALVAKAGSKTKPAAKKRKR